MIAAGGAIEVIGNRQLEIFKRRRRPGQTLMTGVWAWSRHPNYFGNTLVYVGMFVAAMRDPSRWWTVVSPITILLVLRFVLGVRMTDQLMLEKRAGDPAYLDYVARTPAFVMKPPARRKAPLPATDESANLT
jgi:steroid 5-alpha reductase family enzyme